MTNKIIQIIEKLMDVLDSDIFSHTIAIFILLVILMQLIRVAT